MSLKRPNHLAQRQVVGRAFSEKLTLIRTVGSRNNVGEYSEVEQLFPTVCATAPVSGNDARVRLLTEGGVQLDMMRVFWTVQDLDPVVEGHSAGDIVEFEGDRFRIRLTQRWGSFSESIGVRQEGQG